MAFFLHDEFAGFYTPNYSLYLSSKNNPDTKQEAMKFGKIENPQDVEFKLPPGNPANSNILKGKKTTLEIFIGCAKWNKSDLKNFYPKGTKDELAYYATQFNSIELNATFYNNFPLETIDSWHTKTPEGFRFFPKLHQGISHWKRLKDAEQPTSVYLDHISHLEEKLGMLFLQMPDNFGPKNWEVLRDYLEVWPSGFPLALELRHAAWYDGSWDNSEFYAQLEKKNITHIITDTAGRRDLLHMRLTTPTAFVRYNGANVDSDYSRLDDWLDRLKLWADQGLENIYFFVHQNHEEASPLLSAYLIEKVNKEFGTDIKIPHNPQSPPKKGNSGQIGLF